MVITRHPDYPADGGHLLDMYNKCSDGFDKDVVLNAVLHFLTMVLMETSQTATQAELEEFVRDRVPAAILQILQSNRDHKPGADDIPVTSQ